MGSKKGVWEEYLGWNLPARELKVQGDLNVFVPLLFPLLSPTTTAILLLPWSMSFNKECLDLWWFQKSGIFHHTKWIVLGFLCTWVHTACNISLVTVSAVLNLDTNSFLRHLAAFCMKSIYPANKLLSLCRVSSVRQYALISWWGRKPRF